jgi:DNA-binding NarL/FixJ family response regulator
MTEQIRVTLADDHPIVLAGLHNLIAAEADLDLVGEANNGPAALKLIREKSPHVAVLDISMPGLNGLAVARRLKEECPAVRVVILTLYEDQAFVKQALAAGVKGYVHKRSAAENLIEAIRTVALGGTYMDPLLAPPPRDSGPARASKAPPAAATLGLTDREASVLKYLARGLTTKEIAGRLDLSTKTVETYKARATEKLGLKTRAEIVRFGAAQGWLEEV